MHPAGRRRGHAVILALTFALLTASTVDAGDQVSYTFEVTSVPVTRSERAAVVDIVATLSYKPDTPSGDYPDIRPIVEDVTKFVRTYPNPKAYYEVIAKEAAMRMLSASAAVSSVTVVLNIYTDENRSYQRVVRAVVTR